MKPHPGNSAKDGTEQMGVDPPFRLLMRFSLPCVIGMVVNSLYNIVDRMFVGHGAGEKGIAAITVSFPLMMVLISFSTLVGVGSNTLFSIKMGEGRKELAERILGNAFVLLFAFPAAAAVAAVWWLDPLLRLMGCSDALLPSARTYAAVVLGGAALSTTGHGLSHFLRSDGHPVESMVAMLIGAVVNTALDALFILYFGWGVAGAAWATVIAQGCSFLWCFLYFLRPSAHIRIRRSCLAPDWRRVVGPFLLLGVTPFAMNMCNSLLNVILNRSLQRYGGDSALAVMGILASFMGIVFMTAMGIGQGVAPLMGYNYGARLYRRVAVFFRHATLVITGLMVAGWLVGQFAPGAVMRMFVDAASPLVPMGDRALRMFTLAFPVIGFCMMSGMLFQSIGKPWHAFFLSLARQLVFFIPFLLACPHALPALFAALSPLDSVYLAAPMSDLLTFAVSVAFVRREFGIFRRLEAETAIANAAAAGTVPP